MVIGYYCVDEANVDKKFVVEANGCFWHACQKCYTEKHRAYPKIRQRAAGDTRRNTWLRNHGWTLVEVWGHDWNNRPDWCVEQIVKTWEGLK